MVIKFVCKENFMLLVKSKNLINFDYSPYVSAGAFRKVFGKDYEEPLKSGKFHTQLISSQGNIMFVYVEYLE